MRQLTFGKGIQEISKRWRAGRKIIFDVSPKPAGEQGFYADIWTMRVHGTGARQLTPGGFDVKPVWPPATACSWSAAMAPKRGSASSGS
jgi:hypothetical protein